MDVAWVAAFNKVLFGQTEEWRKGSSRHIQAACAPIRPTHLSRRLKQSIPSS